MKIGFTENFVHDHEKFDEASMKSRRSFDDDSFVAMCKWALIHWKIPKSLDLNLPVLSIADLVLVETGDRLSQ